MSPSDVATLIGLVNNLDGRVAEFQSQVNGRLDEVCKTVSDLVTEKAVAAAVKAQTKEIMAGQQAQATKHTLDLRWRVGIVIAAVSGSCGAIGTTIVVLRIIVAGHL